MVKVSSPLSVFANRAPAAVIAAGTLLEKLRQTALVRREDWDTLPQATQHELEGLTDSALLLSRLVGLHLVTAYQAGRIGLGKVDDLVIGNYRVVDFLGSGGMGTVLKAEHRRLRRPVALKLLALCDADDSKALERFYTEIWVLAQLNHPNIVAALDAGDLPGANPEGPALHYLAMEYVPGQDLEELVHAQGPLEVTQACEIIYQIASALEEAHRHKLVHRDIKPSNIRVLPTGQAKLLDFGVTRFFRRRLTEPGTVLGSLPFLAPEQAQDSSVVDIRTDIFALGGTLYWCLTGRLPFAEQGNVLASLAQRASAPSPSVRVHRPELPATLDRVVGTLLAGRPDDRYAAPHDVMRALLPFLRPATLLSHAVLPPGVDAGARADLASAAAGRAPLHRVLIVDDEPVNRTLCRMILEADGAPCREAGNGAEALEALRASPCDVVILDIDMPVLNGTETLKKIRANPPCPHLKVIMVSGRSTADEMAQMMLAGADDYLSKPFTCMQLEARVKTALRLKEAQDRSDLLHRHLLAVNHDLEQNLHARNSDLVHARNALVLALAETVGYRDTETGAHLLRLQRYCRVLAEMAAGSPNFANLVDENFINMLECCAPLHDIGKAGLPDHILLKPGKLTPDERIIMQTHTTIGADILSKVARQHGFAHAFLQMATEIARYHHERFDGQGYPERLAGSTIPLAARLVALADVYDALRSRRVYKPSLSHADVFKIMVHESPGHFDPSLLQIFQQCAPQFELLFRDLVD